MRKWMYATMLVLTAGCFACGDDKNDVSDTGRVADGGTVVTDAGTEPTCPKAGATAHEQFLNAPTNVTVIKKEPRHPGAPGPDGLP